MPPTKQKTYTTYQGWKRAVKRIWGSYGAVGFDAFMYGYKAIVVTPRGRVVYPARFTLSWIDGIQIGTIQTPEA